MLCLDSQVSPRSLAFRKNPINMRAHLVFVLLSALFVALSAGNEQDVVVLDDSNFDYRTKEMDTVLVMFYAPW
jgi:hypothetical protein